MYSIIKGPFFLVTFFLCTLNTLPSLKCSDIPKQLRSTSLAKLSEFPSEEKSRKHALSANSEDQANNEEEEEKNDSKPRKAPKNTRKSIPASLPNPPALAPENVSLARLITASCKNTHDQNLLRCAVYDLLHSNLPASPDKIMFDFRDGHNVRHSMSILAYALFHCPNEDIIRLLAQHSSHELKEEALCYKTIVEKLKTNSNLRDPYFSCFFAVPQQAT